MTPPAKTDIAVLMLFFTRSDTLQLVFNEVRKARPSRLFLYQDGPRDERDLPGIEACRRIVSDDQIDWQCDVHRQYLDHNQGCDPSGFRSHQWAFSLADKVIVLEDDVVPSQSFFPFCKEMLDRYEHDERITMVCGFNTDEVTTDVGQDDYFFTSYQSIWGWASWRRVAQRCQGDYAFMHDPQTLARLKGMGMVLTIASSRQENSLKGFLHDMGIEGYVSMVVGADNVLKGKPDPEAVLVTLKATGIPATEAMVVGDMPVDIMMGKGAGTLTCGVAWGNSCEKDLSESGADYIIYRMSELPGITGI
jgi:HAD superfamily hydrolase (TIGR01549 family)